MRSATLLGIALVVITLAVYWQVGNNEFLNLDDDLYVTSNDNVKSGITGENIVWAFTSFDNPAGFWHPLTWLSHMADTQLYGMNPRGHHFTNVAIHTVSALLVLCLFFRITGALWQSAFVAAMFALHPLNVESVAWVAERKDVLSAFFWFLTLFLYSEYVAKRKPALYILALISFVLGLMSKPMVVTLPIVMLFMDFWPLNRYMIEEHGQKQKRLHKQKHGREKKNYQFISKALTLIKEKIPFLAFSLLVGLITIYTQNKHGATQFNDHNPFILRVENSLTAYFKYIVNIFWPHDLAVYYPFPASIPLWQALFSLFILLVISFAVFRFGRKYPYLPIGWLWFLVTLAPVIGLFQAGNQSMADRFTYIPKIGLFIVIAWGVTDLVKGLKHKNIVLPLLTGTVMIAAIVVTWKQLTLWRDNVSLYRHTLQVTTDNLLVHNNLGVALAGRGQWEEASEEYQKALKINPNYISAHYNLGLALARQDQLDEAIAEFRKTLKLTPNYINANYNLGLALAGKGRLDEAIAEFEKALEINPKHIDAHNDLGLALEGKGHLDEAIEEYKRALEINPDYFDAHNNLGIALAGKGRLDEAIAEFMKAFKINPKHINAHNNLGFAFAEKGRLDEAIAEYKKALEINPDSTEVNNNLKIALELQEKKNQAQ